LEKLNTLCTFSGTGGLSLGLENSGYFKTVAFCESNEYRQKVLFNNNPGKYIFSDIRHLGYSNGWTTYRGENYIKGRLDAVCGGPPCQPFSRAGSKKAEKDDRDLWPEMFRFIAESLPTIVIVENVDEFIHVAFPRTKTNLESIGYTVRAFVLPACGIGAQHCRQRAFILAYLNKEGSQEGQRESCRMEKAYPNIKHVGLSQPFAHTLQERRHLKASWITKKDGERDWEGDWWAESTADFGYWWCTESGMGRNIYGASPRLHGTAEKIRQERVEAMGDSVVPRLAELIGMTVGQYHQYMTTSKDKLS
jgi:DNA (cytosine-5)-methyltransferase 1